MTIENDKAIEVINQIRKNLKAFFYSSSYTDKSDDFIDNLENLINEYDSNNKINENQQNHSKKAEKKPFVHLISQSTYNQVFHLKSKLDWNKFNDDIYFNEGL